MSTELSTNALRGLSAAEVRERTAAGETNTTGGIATRSAGQIIRESVFTFVNNTLFILGLALLLLGRPGDALLSAGIVFINALVSSVQEIQAKRKLDQIALLNRPQALVIRDGVEQTIAPEEVVRGDLLKVGAGDQIIVDGTVLGDGRAELDESQVTGEADRIAKTAGDPVFSGSYCVSGSILYIAEKVGAASLANQITAGAKQHKHELTPLQRNTNMLVRVFLLLMIFLEIVMVLNAFVQTRSLVESVQDVTVVAGLIPNGLFLAITVAYAISAVRILNFGVLVQRSNAIESLSNIDTLCVDKTGTLTANRLVFHAVHPLGSDEAELQTILGEMMASTAAGNKTSEALAAAFPREARRVLVEVPFSSARKWSAIAFDDPARRGIYVLGAAEMLRPFLAPGAADAWQAQLKAWSDQGLRVLLAAHHPDPTLLKDDGDATTLPLLTPIGLVSLSDELRAEARETLARFRAAGVEPKIISGDNPETVASLAKQAGLPDDIRLVSGPELDQMDEAAFEAAALSATIFGRITPQQKQRLVQALRKQGRYVAMVGDGVNDVLSLKQANLGVAMQSGSAATRNAADIVLTKDSFAVLSPAVEEGQRIVNGMQDTLRLFLTRTATIALLTIATLMVSSELFPFLLAQSTLMAMLAVGIPTPLIALWARPGPTARTGQIARLLRFLIPASLLSTVFGLLIFFGAIIIEYVVRAAGVPPGGEEQLLYGTALPIAQTALLSFLIFTGLLLVVFVEPPTAWWVGGDELSGDWRPTLVALGCALLYGAILLIPALRDWFVLRVPHSVSFGLIGVATLIWLFLLRWVWRSNALERFLDIDFGARYVSVARSDEA
ncbi:HAD-IC family P-type ATPase [Candidatus Chloroploca sp. Khr17]|uniref:HAD-IC family P-type ATPase n=1 Tax=Candidatus Chloroploca sp. Khr17 TaxID=2496869 RepID=UPI0013E9C48F|nr:HAD-IC family P-type ATPase [Candidatus Chloroploca sp. Khr17]